MKIVEEIKSGCLRRCNTRSQAALPAVLRVFRRCMHERGLVQGIRFASDFVSLAKVRILD